MANQDVRELIARFASEQPDRRMLIWLDDKGKESSVLTRGDLYFRAQGLASMMKTKWKMKMGEHVLLVFFPGTDFVVAMLACLLGGYVAVPVYPPDPNTPKAGLLKLSKAVEVTNVEVVLSHSKFMHVRRFIIGIGKFPKNLKWFDIGKAKRAKSISISMPVAKDDVAFVQFSSGSTGDPKGVCVTHGNLNSNLASIKQSMGMTENTVGVTWVPFYHDMGLVGAILTTIFSGCLMVAMSPVTFLRDPFIWLNAISKYQGTTTCAPNFAYALAVRKISSKKRAELDLSSCTRYSNGAEPVRVETLHHFAETFADQGVKPEYLDPFYGMAENVVLISTHRSQTPPLIIRLSATYTREPGTTIEIVDPKDEGIDIAGNGEPGYDIEVLIVHPDSLEKLPTDTVGEVWVTGPTKVSKYMNRPKQSKEELNAELAQPDGKTYLRSGDMGFFHKGELFICGRIKDMMIVRGRNIFPQDVELTVDATSEEIRPGCCAVFALENTEDVLVVAEVRDPKVKDATGLAEQIRANIISEHSLRPYDIVLIKPRSIPKTTSGKIKRRGTRDSYVRNELSILVQSIAPQAAAGREEIDDFMDIMLKMELFTKPEQMQQIAKELNLEGVEAIEAMPCMHEPESLIPIVETFQAILSTRSTLASFLGQVVCAAKLPPGSGKDNLIGVLSYIYLAEDIVQLMQHDQGIFRQILTRILGTLPETMLACKQRSWFAYVQSGLLAKCANLNLQAGNFQLSDEEIKREMELNILIGMNAELLKDATSRASTVNCAEKLVKEMLSKPVDDDFKSIIEVCVAWNYVFMECYRPQNNLPQDLSTQALLLLPSVMGSTSLREFHVARVNTLILQLGSQTSHVFSCFTDTMVSNMNALDTALEHASTCMKQNGQSGDIVQTFMRLYASQEQECAPTSLQATCDTIREHLRNGNDNLLGENYGREIWPEMFASPEPESEGELDSLDDVGDTPEERMEWLFQCVKRSIQAPTLQLDDDLFDAGISSMAMVKITSELERLTKSDEPLDPDFIAKHRTIRKLAEAVEIKRTQCITLDELPMSNSIELPSPFATFLQFIGIWAIFFTMSVAIIPAYHYGYYIRYESNLPQPWTSYNVTNSVKMFGLLVPFVIPIWLLSFTILTILIKWSFLGRWAPREIRINSIAHMRWWFVDRMLHMWELAVGRWILNTPMINIVYIMLGGNISPTAKVKTTLRDLDLLQINAAANVKGMVICRVFDTQNRTLRFRRVTLDAGCQLGSGSVVMPGCVVGRGVQLGPLQVLSEGERLADVPDISPRGDLCWTAYELVAKFTIMVLLLVLYFNASLVNWLIWEYCGYPEHFRYAQLIAWASSYLVTGFTMSLVAIGLKWVLLGRVKPGLVSARPSVRVWTSDYLYGLVYTTWIVLLGETRSIMFYARALGASIGKGCVSSELRWICPSNADMIRMGNSVMSSPIIVEPESNGRRDYITIGDHSELGLMAVIGRGAVIESGSSLGSLSILEPGEVLPSGQRKFQGGIFPIEGNSESSTWSPLDELITLFMRIVLVTATVFSLVPAYEFANYVLYETGMQRDAAISLIAVSFFLAMLSLIIVQKLMALAILGTRPDLLELPCKLCFYCTYQLYTWYFENLLLPVTHGTPFYNAFARFMGARIGNDVIIQSGIIREHQLITVEEKTIIDCNSFVTGHQFTNGYFDVGPTHVGCEVLLHPGSICLAHSSVTSGSTMYPRRFALQDISASEKGDTLEKFSKEKGDVEVGPEELVRFPTSDSSDTDSTKSDSIPYAGEIPDSCV